MRLVVQRVTSARVEVDGETAGEIAHGLAVLACAMKSDVGRNVEPVARKLVNLRVFRDDSGKMNRSVRDVGGGVLLVSQFTLAADVSRGNRPGFSSAAPPDQGKSLIDELAVAVRSAGVPVETGVFGAEMAVSLVNDGPVTIWMDL